MAAAGPNILVLMADQMTPLALPAYGHAVVRAPTLARLAGEGVVFDAAYCASPLCAPSRYTLMAGRLASGIGAYDNAAELGSAVPTLAHHLRAAGYRTTLCGKMHFCGPDQLHGFEERLTTDIYPADFGWTPDWARPDHRPAWYHNMGSVIDAGPAVRTNQLDFDEEVVFHARQALFDAARGSDPRPFLLVVSLTHPHDPFAIPERYFDLYRDGDIDPPRVRMAPGDLDPHSRRLRLVSDVDAASLSEGQVIRARRAYYGSISYVDEQFGAVLRTLGEAGLAGDTVVVVLSDHGELLGERGLWFKMSFLEGSARVPLIVHAPGMFPARRVPEAVSLLDVLPTLAGIARDGRDPDDDAGPLDGRSLLPHLTGSGGRDLALGEYLAEGALAPIVMVRRGQHKFVHSPADPDQLFDLADDPDELRNLATEPGSADLLAAFRAEVAARWDLPALHADVLASQRRRRFVNAALRRGRHRPWDFQPVRDASGLYVRNHQDDGLDDAEARARLPRIARRTPAGGNGA